MYDRLYYDQMELTILYSPVALTPHNYPHDNTQKPDRI